MRKKLIDEITIEVKTIPLTKGRSVMVDAKLYPVINQYHWHFSPKGENPEKGYARGYVNGKMTYLHRWLLGDPDSTIDHIDGNTMNCTMDNMRLCTSSVNNRNKAKQKGTTSKYKGVCLTREKWVASISLNNKRYRLGAYSTELEAAHAYDSFCREVLNDEVPCNFPILPVTKHRFNYEALTTNGFHSINN